MGNCTIYFSKEDEHELRTTAALRGLRLQDILRERLKIGRDMEEVAKLRQTIEQLEDKVKGQEDRLNKQLEVQADWINKISALILAKTSFLEELFILINKENDQEYRNKEASEAAAKFMETLHR
jgi:molybdopterin converting factor small subunit